MSVFTVLNPATEEPVTTVEQVSAEEADFAIARAEAAWPAWRAVTPGDRARLLRAFAALVDAHVEDEWSLSQTLRHLILATDAWLRGGILRMQQPFHEIGQSAAHDRR